MNARSLIFLICMAVSFFVVHYFFDSRKENEIAQWQQEQQVKMEEILRKEERRTSLSDRSLNAVALYEDQSKSKLFTLGSKIDNSILVFSNKKYPKTLYTEDNRTVNILSEASKNSPALYGLGSPTLQIPSFSDKSLLYLLCTNCKSDVTTAYAKMDKGRVFSLPEIKGNAIVFVKDGRGFSPVAVYEGSSKKVRGLKSYFSIKPFIEERTVTASTQKIGNEEYFVLENDYQQLVFSTVGGALVEINLPLKETKDSKSLVNPIDVDRIMEKDYPENDLFPQNSYNIVKNGSRTKVSKGTLGGYYPLLRRSIYNKNGQIQKKIDPKYYAYNILSEDGDTEYLTYRVTRFDENSITLEASQPYRRISKTFSFNKEKAPYMIDLDIKVDGDIDGLYLSSGVPEAEILSSRSNPVIKLHSTRSGKYKVESLKLPETTNIDLSVTPDWLCNSNGFLGMIVDPVQDSAPGYMTQKADGNTVPTRLTVIDSKYNLYPADKFPGYLTGTPLKSSMSMRLFSGPFQDTLLKRLDQIFSIPKENYNPDYTGAITIHGWFSFISEPIGKLLFFLMNIFYKLTHSWGFSIILLTVALRAMLYPINNWSMKGMRKMQELTPKVKEIQEKYKKDPQRQQMELAKIYRENGATPAAGCIGPFLPLPILMGMYDVLKSKFELRGASFIPGWIDNLAAPDVLFSWSYPIPLIGTEFHLLPIISCALFYVQQKITTARNKNKAPKGSDLEKQQKMIAFFPILMLVFFYKLPAGLNLYFLCSTLLGIVQQVLINKKMDAEVK